MLSTDREKSAKYLALFSDCLSQSVRMMAQYLSMTFIRPSNTHPKESFLLKIVQRYIIHAMLVGKCKKDEKINIRQKMF